MNDATKPVIANTVVSSPRITAGWSMLPPARLAQVRETELDEVTERIAILNQSREQLARFVDDVRQEAIGPGQPEPAVPTGANPDACSNTGA